MNHFRAPINDSACAALTIRQITTWKVGSFAGRQGLRLSGWHQHLQYFITGFALGKISLA